MHQPLAWSPDVLQRRSLDAVLVLRPPGEPLRLSGIAPLLWAMFEKPSSPADVAAAAVDAFSVAASEGASMRSPRSSALWSRTARSVAPEPGLIRTTRHVL